MYRGYIKAFRKLVEWEWYRDITTCHLFLHCLLKANHKDNNWRGITIKRGSLLTSLAHLSLETGLSVQQVRTAINKLKLTNDITSKTTNRNTIITVNNYDLYQEDNTLNNKQITNNQQTNNKQITTNNNDNNVNNDKNVEEVEESNNYGSYYNVFLLNKDYQILRGLVMNDKILNEIIEDLSIKIATGKEQPYKDNLPHAHFERLKAYFKYRRNNTDKVKPITQSVIQELQERELKELAERKKL